MNALPVQIKKYRVVVTDIFVLLLVYLIPAGSHLLPFPLYILDPMRILLFTGYLLSQNSKNAYFLAITIPIFSMLITGHPVFAKSLLIAMELFVNIFIVAYWSKYKGTSMYVVIFCSVIISKVVYYLMKYLFLSVGWLSGDLFSTGILTQLLVALVITIVFTYYHKKLAAKK
jgi:hypothetical protein